MAQAYDTASAKRSTGRRTHYVHARIGRNVTAIDGFALAPALRTARSYNHVGHDYGQYADGGAVSGQSTSAHSRYEQGDAIVWQEVRQSLDELRRQNVSDVRVLDAGCGPGTWTRKIAGYAQEIGLGIRIVGVDISTTQLDIAREEQRRARVRSNATTSSVEFQECDLSKPLPWAGGFFNLVLCNYTVLNHVAEDALPATISELCRVSSGNVIATLRAIGSAPTACIIGMEHVREYLYDDDDGELRVTLDDASRHRLIFKMYTAEALGAMFALHAEIRELRAIDIFAGRFADDRKWTSALLQRLPQRRALLDKLEKLEEELCRQPGWIDHGTHVLIVARSKSVAKQNARPVLKVL